MTNLAPKLRDSLAELIAISSVSSINPDLDQSNKEIVEVLANWREDLGFSLELMPVSDTPEKLNLIACMGKGEGGLVLSGHTDTVPYDVNAWHQDPFVLTEKDNKLYGLGVSDMKCFFPLVMEVIQQLDLKSLHRPLFIVATADEESTMAGAQALADSGISLGRHALIGEPTGLVPVHMHKGVMIEVIRLSGCSGHSSDPSLGNSALEGMHAVISSLIQWREDLQMQNINNDFHVPIPTLNFGSIHGGDNPNRI
ncbi:MAG: M20/M25/M40 family metallo-hydrolase [Gammaproteobacteria bacterium]